MQLEANEEIIPEVETEVERFYCPVEDCPKHKSGYANKNSLLKHINSAHPDLQE